MSTRFGLSVDGLNELPCSGEAIADLEKLTFRDQDLRALRAFLDWFGTPPLKEKLRKVRAGDNPRVRIITDRPLVFAVDVQGLVVKILIQHRPEPVPCIQRIYESVIA
jgi:hypothetical protein